VLQAIARLAATVVREERVRDHPHPVAATASVLVGPRTVGIVAAVGEVPDGLSDDQQAWLDAGAAAAAVVAVMRDAQEGGIEGSRRTLLRTLCSGPPADVDSLVNHARRLGFDLDGGGIALFALRTGGDAPSELPVLPGALLAELDRGRVGGLIPARSLAGDGAGEEPAAVAARLAGSSYLVALSAPRREPAALHEALREAELLAELGAMPEASLAGQEETYRLLIGVLLRDPDELERLRDQTVASLLAYDAEHETELVATLQAFLAHDCSTSDTAEALELHRHTVGYRLSRAHEVSGLSPYESEGRERLGLGLKAHHILDAAQRAGAAGSGR
jgi:hypothetical protein